MTSEQVQAYIKGLETRLAADGCDPRWENWGPTPVLIARRSDFQLSWLATRLHLFTLVIAIDEITRPGIEAFTDQATKYAKANKGGLPVGLQNGVAVFPVIVGDRIDPAAASWAEAKQRNHFGVMGRPVVIDATQGQARVFRGNLVIGRLYASHLVRKANLYFPQS